MKLRSILFALLAAVAAPSAAQPSAEAPADDTIRLGQVLDDTLGTSVNGWQHSRGSMYTIRETADGVTTEKLTCCVAEFHRENSYIVAVTEPLARNPDGGVIKERVIALVRLDAGPDESYSECGLFGLNLGLSLKDEKTGMVRSVVIDQGGLQTFEWKDSEGRCGYGDD